MLPLLPRIPFGLPVDQIHSESMRLDNQANLVTIIIFQGRITASISNYRLVFQIINDFHSQHSSKVSLGGFIDYFGTWYL